MNTHMPRPRPPFLHKQITRHGIVTWYVRRGKGKRIRIRGAFGSPEFQAAYEAAVRGEPPKPQPREKYGTLAWLVGQYRATHEWATLSAATRRQRDNIFKHILAKSGDKPFTDIVRKHVKDGMDSRKDRPAAARHFLETLRGMFQWALEADHVLIDPTAGIKAPKKRSKGHHVWTEEEVAAYEAKWPLGTRERVALDVLLYTGLRRGDAVRLGAPHVRNGIATLRTEKSGHLVEVTIRILPQLERSLKAGPTGDLTFIAGERGRPMTKESFGNWFRAACKEAGVPGSAHGLRKCGATRAADAGATEHELMAMFGWTEPRTAAIYTREANRRRLALAASEKLISIPSFENPVGESDEKPVSSQVLRK